MRLPRFFFAFVLPIIFSGCFRSAVPSENITATLVRTENSPPIYILPPPNLQGSVSVEEAMAVRRSHRLFVDRALSIEQVSQILWAAYGITLPLPAPQLRGGLRTVPSAGAVFPLEIYLVVGNVTGMAAGVYRYDSSAHSLTMVIEGDVREALTVAALGQPMIRTAPITLIHAADFRRIVAVYGERGHRYTWIEVGHSAQNIYLQAEALGLGTVAVGAFIDGNVSAVLQLPPEEAPLYLMPIGFVQ
ncbi:MAG: SagB/ThcOx family dehydrogenase [Spirochaetes bacterium]|nr:SagB/ThcOx family dehydrogenase [Spirochaetota bacterium]